MGNHGVDMGINLCFVVVAAAAVAVAVAVVVVVVVVVLTDQPSYDVQNPGCLKIHVGIVLTHIILEMVTIHARGILFATNPYVLYVYWCFEQCSRCWCFLQIKWPFRKYTTIFRHIRIFILYVKIIEFIPFDVLTTCLSRQRNGQVLPS